jgi:hypothetical protein
MANKRKKKVMISLGVNLEPAMLDQIKLLAKGWDRSVCWCVRELVDAALFQHSDEVDEFRLRYADELGIVTPSTPHQAADNTPSLPVIMFPPPADVSPSSTIDSEKAEAAGDLS